MAGFSTFKVPKILYIHGVFVEDCKEIEDLLEERLLDINAKKEKKINKTIPYIYNGINNWVKSCNIKCYYCDKFFTTIPLFLPKSVEKNENNDLEMQREGCFDSWPCLAKYVELHYPGYSDKMEKTNMILALYKDMTGRSLKSIPSNINKYDMECYEGDLTPIEWDKKNKLLMIEAELAEGYHKEISNDPERILEYLAINPQ